MTTRRIANTFVALAIVVVASTEAMAVIRVTVRPVTLLTASPSDTAATLPISQTQLLPGQSFVLELWAQTTETSGLSSVTLDVSYANTVVTAQTIIHTALFDAAGLSTGSINDPAGLIDDVGGSHSAASPPCSDQVGLTTWARVAIVQMLAVGNGPSVIQTNDSASLILGTAICNEFGNVPPVDIDFGQITVSVEDCYSDADCDDNQFCNGPEQCVGNVCQAGTAPDCSDTVGCTDDSCDAAANVGTGACLNAPNDANCDDNQFCNGSEICDALLDCQAGTAVCTAACEHCDELGGTCELCILDLDLNGVMGTGDFALFAACFDGCYLATDPCAASDFDSDGSFCVGTGDYSGFVGCFGLSCSDCVNCAGPPLARATSQTEPAAVIRLVTVRAPTADDSLAALPSSRTSFKLDQTFFVELWATRPAATAWDDDGLAAVFVDLSFDAGSLVVEEVVSSLAMSTFAGGNIHQQAGLVSQLGGCSKLDSLNLGAEGTWVRVATLSVRASAIGDVTLAVGPSDPIHGVAIVNELGNLDPGRIDFGTTLVNIVLKPEAHKLHRQPRGSLNP